MRIAATRIGRAIVASGLTVTGGFAVLAFSGFPLLEAFGKVTALNVGLALLSALIVLPPLLVWLDQRMGLLWRPSASPRPSPGEAAPLPRSDA
jgi:predicted RND superfamily exporter protein